MGWGDGMAGSPDGGLANFKYSDFFERSIT